MDSRLFTQLALARQEESVQLTVTGIPDYETVHAGFPETEGFDPVLYTESNFLVKGPRSIITVCGTTDLAKRLWELASVKGTIITNWSDPNPQKWETLEL